MAEPNGTSPHHHYNLIASAIAGRAISVHWHDNARLASYTDSRNIFLSGVQRNENQVLDVIAQALLIRCGALNHQYIKHLVGRPQLAERYAYAELCRAVSQHNRLLPKKICEHPAIKQFPTTPKNSKDSLQLAISKQTLPATPDFLGVLRTVLILRTNVPDSAFTALSRKLQNKDIELSDIRELDEDEEESAEESKILKLFQNPFGSGGALSDMINKMLNAGRGGKPEEDPNASGGSELKVGNIAQAKKKGVFATLTDVVIDIVANQQPNDAGSTSYPEWNYIDASYRDHWALVDEMDPWREEPEPDQTLNELLQPPSITLKKKLAGIGLSFETHHYQQHGEDLSLDGIIDYVKDYRMGITPNENIYSHNMKTCRNLAAMVLLDISGSTAEKDPLGQSIHHKQLQLAYHMTYALHELGDRVSMYAFHSWGKSLVRLLRIKSFVEQRIDYRMRERMAMLEPAGYTRTGAALRHAAHKLQSETGMPYRLLIVITDGFSYDHDYENKYGEEDTRKALEEIRASGTGCLCLTIGSQQDEEKLSSVYGPASTLSVNNYEQFLSLLRPAMLKAIRQVVA